MGVSVASPGTISGVSNANRLLLNGVSSASARPLSVSGSSGLVGQSGAAPMTTTSPINTYNPQQSAPAPSYNGATLGANTGGGTGGGGTATVDPNIEKLNQAKSGVNGIVNSIFSVYNALYNDVGSAAADKSSQVESKYGTENKAITDQYGRDFGQIGQSFAARGAYDSSYRGGAEGDLTGAYQNSMAQQDVAKRGDLANVGQFLAQARGGIEAGRGSLTNVQNQIAQATDVNEILSLQNSLQTKLAELQTQQAGAQGQNYYLNQLNQQTGTASALPRIQQSLTNVLSANVPAPIKRSIATQLIVNSELSQQEKDQLSSQIDSQINQG